MHRYFVVTLGASWALVFGACVGDEPQVQSQTDAGGDGPTGADSPAGDSPGADTAPGPDGAGDAGSDAPALRCDPKKPFGAPVLVDVINGLGHNDYEARLSPDELVVYFGSDRAGDGIYQAARSSASLPFAAPTLLQIGGAAGAVASPTVSGDGLTIVFFEKAGATPSTLDLATRASTLSPFANAAAIANVTSLTQDVATPYLVPDKSALYYQVGGKIQRSDNAGGTFQKGTDVAGTASAGQDTYPAVTPDQLVIYWASDRTDLAHTGADDVFVARRGSPGDGFGAPSNVVELNTTANDRPSWISPDECVIYLSSERPAGGGAGGEQHVFVAKRPL